MGKKSKISNQIRNRKKKEPNLYFSFYYYYIYTNYKNKINKIECIEKKKMGKKASQKKNVQAPKPEEKKVVKETPKKEEEKEKEVSKATQNLTFCPCRVALGVVALLISILIGYILLTGATQSSHSILLNLDTTTRLSPEFLGIDGAFYKSNISGLYIHHKEWKPNRNANVYADPEYNIDDEQLRYPRAIVVISPGRYLHSEGWFDSFASRLAEEGAVAVFAFDQPGFGKSEGDRGYAESMDTLVDEAESFVRAARAKYPGVPTVCLGEDIGAYTMAQLSYKKKLYSDEEAKIQSTNGKKNILCNGVAMFAPPKFGIIEKLYVKSEFFKKVINFLSERVPKLPVPVYYPNFMLTSDPEVSKLFANDKFASKMMRVRTLKLMMDARNEIREHPEKITATLEIVQGMNDTLTDDAYNQAIVEGATHVFKSVGITEKAKHFVVTDKGTKDKTYSEFVDWLRLAIYNMVEDFGEETEAEIVEPIQKDKN